MNDRRLAAVLVLSIAVLPLDFNPLRFDPYEPHRAGLLALVVLLALPGLRFPRRLSPLLAAVLLWGVALTISALFSLSPARSLTGDVIRRTGLWTQLALVAGAFVGARLDPARMWRWFWAGGVIASVYALLQAAGGIPTILQFRPPGTIGVPTFAGGWLALVSLWAGLGWWGERSAIDSPLRRIGFPAGLVLMLAALLMTGSRGAVTALCAGLVTGVLLWAAIQGSRKIAVIVIIILIGGGTSLFVLNRVDWRASPLAQLPLISRLNPNLPDSPRISRELIWANALSLSRKWPAMISVNGQSDPYHALRPVVGYGLEMFEVVHRPLMTTVLRQHEVGRPVDRAHNDWLDTLVSMGWLGAAARLMLWISALWVGLGKLGIRGSRLTAMAFAGAGLVLCGLAAGNTPYVALAMTLGALGGFWLWLLWGAFLRTENHPPLDLSAWLALALLTAHIVDLQFSFTTVITGWPAWLALGLLLNDTSNSALSTRHSALFSGESRLAAGWLAIGGALLLRSLIATGAAWDAAVVILIALIVTARFLAPIPAKAWWWIGIVWLAGTAAGLSQSPELSAMWDIALLAAGTALIAVQRENRIAVPPKMLAYGGLTLLALFVWLRDIAADIHLSRALEMSGAEAAHEIEPAVSYRPYDDRLLSAAATLALRTGDDYNATWPQAARVMLEQAVSLNPYDSTYAYLLAVAESQLALMEPDWTPHLEQANRYYASAVRLTPNEPYLWREWARFSLDFLGNSDTACARIRQAVGLDRNDRAARNLMVRACGR